MYKSLFGIIRLGPDFLNKNLIIFLILSFLVFFVKKYLFKFAFLSLFILLIISLFIETSCLIVIPLSIFLVCLIKCALTKEQKNEFTQKTKILIGFLYFSKLSGLFL